MVSDVRALQDAAEMHEALLDPQVPEGARYPPEALQPRVAVPLQAVDARRLPARGPRPRTLLERAQ